MATTDKDFGAIWDDCPVCDAVLVADEYIEQRCNVCGWQNDTDVDSEEMKALERAAFGGHEDVYIDFDGQPQRVFGDPNMSEETKQALAKMIKAVTKAVADGKFDDDKESE